MNAKLRWLVFLCSFALGLFLSAQCFVPDALAADYQLTYNYAENGGVSVTKTTVSTAGGTALDLTPQASKTGWEFVGWNTDKDAVTPLLPPYIMPASNVTLYAVYKKTLTATFRDYSGRTPISRTESTTIYNKAVGGEIMVPVQNRYTDGWTARGWSPATAPDAGIMLPSGAYTITADTTFYGLYQRTLVLSYRNDRTEPGRVMPANESGTQYISSYDISASADPKFVVRGGPSDQWYDREGGERYRSGDIITLSSSRVLWVLRK